MKLTITGVIRTDLTIPDDATLGTIRSEASSRFNDQPIKLLFSGRILPPSDDAQPLAALGLADGCTLMASRASPTADVQAQDIARAAETLADRSASLRVPSRGGHTPELTLTDQHGNAVRLSREDSALVAQGLLLQTRANDLSRARRYTDALPLLDLACDALGRVSSDLLRTAADNYALALLDRCWCVFSCRLVARYPTATQDLALCLSLLQQMHGPNMERLTRLSHGLRPEHAVYAKLHLLRGVTDYELGRHDAAHAAFALARAHAAKLAVDEGAVTALIAAAGGRLPVATARMALRCSEGRVDDALAYVTELRVRAGEERARRRRRAQDREDQAYLGRTASGRHVDMDAVAQLTSAAGGRVDRRVVGAVLRSCDNNVTYASEILFNEVKLGAFLLGQVVQRWYGGYYVEEAQRRRRKAAKKKRKELEAEAAEGAGPSSRSGAGPSRGAAAAPVLASGCAPREVDRAARAVGDPEQLQAAGPDPDPDVEGGSEEEEEEGKQEAEEAALLASLQRQGRDGFASYDDEGCGEVIARVLAEYEARMAGTT